MAEGKLNKLWVVVVIVLVAAIIVGGIIIKYKLGSPPSVELLLPNPENAGIKETLGTGSIYVGGSVAAPGWFPIKNGDTIPDLIQAAGGTTGTANVSLLELRVIPGGSTNSSQKIDINRADTWLLEALPEIGKTLAQRIVDYRQTNGRFNNISDIQKVPGIGNSVYDKIKDLITVADP